MTSTAASAAVFYFAASIFKYSSLT